MVAKSSVIFLIRDKLGDSLIAANVALGFARRHPDWSVSIMIREAYVHPLERERDITLVPYRSGLQAQLLAWWWRLRGRRYDVLGVMRGFGKRTSSLIRRIPACRVVVHDQRLSEVVTDVAIAAPGETKDDPHFGPALRVARMLDAMLPAPDHMSFPGLVARWQTTAKRFVSICPISDEHRRNIPTDTLESLYGVLREKHPEYEIVILVRRHADLQGLSRVPAVPVREFHDIPRLMDILLRSSHFYGTDTGLLHLAMAMGMPCTVFFGPTQPYRVLPAAQPNVEAWRAATLGDEHCDNKSCTKPGCIARAVMMFARGAMAEKGVELPADCPWREGLG